MGKHGPVSPSTRVSSRRRTLFEGGRRVRYGGDGVVVFIGSVFEVYYPLGRMRNRVSPDLESGMCTISRMGEVILIDSRALVVRH